MRYNLKKICGIVLTLLAICLFAFPFIADEQLIYTIKTSDMATLSGSTPPLMAGDYVTQNIVSDQDTIDTITVLPATFARINQDVLRAELCMEDGTPITETYVLTEQMTDLQPYEIKFETIVQNVKNQTLVFRVTSEKGNEESHILLCLGNTISTGKTEIPLKILDVDQAYYNGQALDSMLCLSVSGTNFHIIGQYYWQIACIIFILVCFCVVWLLMSAKKQKSNIVLRWIDAFFHYKFLIKQIVQRNFKTKYARSALGVLWSLLNPLLTMAVQYLVFSTMFKSSIENFPIYLLTGIVCFNFFNEAANLCLISIVGNTHLITKVYIPKYIFPFSATLSASINFLISLIPLAGFLIATGSPFSQALALLPLGMFFLFMFTMGMGLLLSSMMVFFRDTQFLWGVVSMLWLYITPIFYPVSIIPKNFMSIYSMNPMYQIISFFRTILISGISPSIENYYMCIFSSLITLLLGLVVFKKTQDSFIFNL